jgi:hypothetical protein
MAARVTAVQKADRCDLCGYRSTGTFADRIGHLRTEHPAYARGLLLRLAAPFAFLVTLLGLAALRAPQWAYLVAMAASVGVLVAGWRASRTARATAGARPGVPISRLMREGGLRIALLVPALALIVVVASRR